MTGSPIRVLLANDHRLFGEGLKMLLQQEPDIEVLGVATSAEEALRLSPSLGPDVVLMDIDLPGMRGIEATNKLRAACPESQVVVLSAHRDVERVAAALDAGAIGYLPKSHAADSLVRSIRAAARGETSIPAPYIETALSERRNRRDEAQPAAGSDLTPRERQVLGELAQGRSVAEVAEGLHLSVFTLRGHVRGILRKLDVRSIAQAVARALREGLVNHQAR